MDLDYDIDSWMVTTRSLTIFSTISYVLKCTGLRPGCMTPMLVLTKALKRIENLKLPRDFIEEMKSVVQSVIMDMLSWYNKNPDCSTVVMTSQGTVDLSRSARLLLKSPVSAFYRYRIACDYCHEDDIFDIGRELSPEDKRVLGCESGPATTPSCSSLPEYWLHVYKGSFAARLSLDDLTDEAWTAGFKLALKCQNSTALKFFVQRNSQKAIQQAIMSSWAVFADPMVILSPDTYAAMYAILNDGQRAFMKSILSSKMLIALLEWPYQKIFLDAAKTLTGDISSEAFWKVATRIAAKAASGNADHDYQELFVAFWNLGSKQRSASQLCLFQYCVLVQQVRVMNNHTINKLVLGHMPMDDGKKSRARA